MEDSEQIRQECLLAALQYFDPVLMELQMNQDEQLHYTHKFFAQTKDAGAILYRVHRGKYEVTDQVIPEPPAQQKKLAPTQHEPADQTQVLDDPPIEIRALQYTAQPPLFTFDQLVVPMGLMDDLLSTVEVLRVQQKVFEEWGLRKIEPYPHVALNFHGVPGTGKTLAAHAIAHSLKRPILVASYAEIESKFHGEGPKNVKAIFHAAARDNAVLFIDEADSLLSKRLTEVTHGSEQAINSMRSQLFICLQEFQGIVIFATNLVKNYDKAFETRVRYFRFPMPDEAARREIWRKHLVPQLPLDDDLSIEQLAVYTDNICGRDIKNAVIDAAVRAARRGAESLSQRDLTEAITRIKTAKQEIQYDE